MPTAAAAWRASSADLHITHIRDSRGDSLSGGERRGWRSPGRWPRSHGSCCSTSPLPVSIRCRSTDIQRIIRFLSERGIGVLITDHNVRETLGICDRAYIVNEGLIIAEGTPQDILKNQRVREVYLGHDFTL